jgi:hypothetical protein
MPDLHDHSSFPALSPCIGDYAEHSPPLSATHSLIDATIYLSHEITIHNSNTHHHQQEKISWPYTKSATLPIRNYHQLLQASCDMPGPMATRQHHMD